VVVPLSAADLLRALNLPGGGDNLLGEILATPMARIGPLVPYALMILILLFRPRGLLGTRET
jgi:branched-chain amino acid transport system permease protein